MAVSAKKELRFVEGVGRRKTAVARVRITEDEKGAVTVNGRPLLAYFTISRLREGALLPLTRLSLTGRFSVSVLVQGGGPSAQSGAVSLGLARALVTLDPARKPLLSSAGLMTRDSRMVERKKFGLKKARRAPQWSKR